MLSATRTNSVASADFFGPARPLAAVLDRLNGVPFALGGLNLLGRLRQIARRPIGAASRPQALVCLDGPLKTFMTLSSRLARVYELPADRPRIGALQGIRGFAVALVFVVHHHTLFGEYAAERSWTSAASVFFGVAGHAGVDLFFVLSGALVYGLVLDRPMTFREFFGRRLRRLYPAFGVVLTLYLIL